MGRWPSSFRTVVAVAMTSCIARYERVFPPLAAAPADQQMHGLTRVPPFAPQRRDADSSRLRTVCEASMMVVKLDLPYTRHGRVSALRKGAGSRILFVC